MAYLITSFSDYIIPETVTVILIIKVQSSWRGKPQEIINRKQEHFPDN